MHACGVRAMKRESCIFNIYCLISLTEAISQCTTRLSFTICLKKVIRNTSVLQINYSVTAENFLRFFLLQTRLFNASYYSNGAFMADKMDKPAGSSLNKENMNSMN